MAAGRSAIDRKRLAQGHADAAQWRQVGDQVRPKLPKLAMLLDEAEEGVLSHMSFRKEHRAKLHSTNRLERVNGEIKRPTEVVRIFPDEAAITRLVGAILPEQNDEWAMQRAPLHASGTITPWRDELTRMLPATAHEHERPDQHRSPRPPNSYTMSRDTTRSYSTHSRLNELLGRVDAQSTVKLIDLDKLAALPGH